MKHLFGLVLLVATPCYANALDCYAPIEIDWSIDDHINGASHIFYGQVVSAELQEERNILFSIEVQKSLKGDLSGLQEFGYVREPYRPEFLVGSYYFIFLYGDSEIHPCAFHMDLEWNIEGYDELQAAIESTNPDFHIPYGLARLLEFASERSEP